MFNPTMTDSYKTTHWYQYPSGTTKVYSYLESRGGVYDNTVFYGLQYYLLEYLKFAFTKEYHQRLLKNHFGKDRFNDTGWDIIENEYGGILPITIKAVPEGTVVPVGNVLMTIENDDPRLFWLTNYVETLLLKVWYPTTVATLSREIKKTIYKYLSETGDPLGLDYKLHDFGYRGASSEESAMLGGSAHLINFKGTDTLGALPWITDYYGDGLDYEMAKAYGNSIDASEHSTITSWGRENEYEAFKNMLDNNPEGLVACVSDSYNLERAIKEGWGGKLKEQVLSRNGTLIVRPDSGEPIRSVLNTLSWLEESFGTTKNNKGYKVLPSQVRMIQGDGINHESIKSILSAMRHTSWSADNIAFGMGGALLQQVNRDTQKFAIKCSYVEVNGYGRDVYKDPITDPGKTSKRGRLKLVKDNDTFITVPESDLREDQLVTVFNRGRLVRRDTFDQIRKRAQLDGQ